MWPNPQKTADLLTFTEEILNAKLHILCSATPIYGFGLPEDYLKTCDFILLCATNANERNGGRQYVLPTNSNWRKTICHKKLNLFYNHRKEQRAHTITKVSASLVSIRNYSSRKILCSCLLWRVLSVMLPVQQVQHSL